jgi:hypothetical protein
MQALNVKKDSPWAGKARKYSMLLAEVPMTLATGSGEAAPTL